MREVSIPACNPLNDEDACLRQNGTEAGSNAPGNSRVACGAHGDRSAAAMLAAAGAPEGAAGTAWEVTCVTMALPDRAEVAEGAVADVSVADLLRALREEGFLLCEMRVLAVTQVSAPTLELSKLNARCAPP